MLNSREEKWVSKNLQLKPSNQQSNNSNSNNNEFDHTTKWYMNTLELVQENKTQKILWYFVIQTYLLIPAWRQDLALINKEK